MLEGFLLQKFTIIVRGAIQATLALMHLVTRCALPQAAQAQAPPAPLPAALVVINMTFSSPGDADLVRCFPFLQSSATQPSAIQGRLPGKQILLS